MMRKKWLIGCSLPFLCVCLLVALFLRGCLRQLTRVPELPVEALLDAQLGLLPPGWTRITPYLTCDASSADGALFRIHTAFFPESQRDNTQKPWEAIYIYHDPMRAQFGFPGMTTFFYQTPRKTYQPSGWTYRPPGAQRFAVNCVSGDGEVPTQYCKFAVRYEEYVLLFEVPFDSQYYLSLEDVQHFLEVTDREMLAFLRDSSVQEGVRPVPNYQNPSSDCRR
jgi:hypothetical protein